MRRVPELGRFQTLEIADLLPDGALLATKGLEELVLPTAEVPEDAAAGDRVRVFVHHGRDGILTATTTTPAAPLGGFAPMRCAAVTKAGAYMDWGLPKDLYVPPHEQAQRMQEGETYVVVVCMDRKKERLIGSTHLASHLDYDVRSFGFKTGGVSLHMSGRELVDGKATYPVRAVGRTEGAASLLGEGASPSSVWCSGSKRS